ncbi:MAG: hypothetical protein WCL32_07525, partial [Planctomycetota bacterium]
MNRACRLVAFGAMCLGLSLAVNRGSAQETKNAEKKNPATTLINRDVPRHKQFLEIAKKGDV